MTASTLQWRNGVVATETLESTKPKILISNLLQKTFADPCSKAMVPFEVVVNSKQNKALTHIYHVSYFKSEISCPRPQTSFFSFFSWKELSSQFQGAIEETHW